MNITEAFLQYQQDGLLRKELINHIQEYIFIHIKQYKLKDEDDYHDFILFFHQRINPMINNFVYEGKPFEHYINRNIRFQMHTFLQMKQERQQKEQLYNYIIARDSLKVTEDPVFDLVNEGFQYPLIAEPVPYTYAHNTENAYPIQYVRETFTATDTATSAKTTTITPRNLPIERKKLLVVSMLNIYVCTYTDWYNLSQYLSCNIEWLYECVEKLKSLTAISYHKWLALKERKEGLFFELQLAKYEQANPLHIQRIERKISSCQSKLNRISTHPTHQMLADVLNIPKGTIDSLLYYMRK